MTLPKLAAELGITDHAVYLLAGNLVGRYGYGAVIVDARSAEITPAAERGIRAFVAYVEGVAAAVALAE
jgi:hypothetical protein